MMAKPITGSYTKEENEITHKKSDFPKLGISYHTYSLTSLGGKREHPGKGQQGRGRLGQQAVTTRWASMKLEGGCQKPAWEVTGARLHTVPLNGGGTRIEWAGPTSRWGNFVKFCTLSFYCKQGGEREAEGSSDGKWPSRGTLSQPSVPLCARPALPQLRWAQGPGTQQVCSLVPPL